MQKFKNTFIGILNKQNRYCGAGFLIDKQHIITCAHVVNTALGLKQNNICKPSNESKISFKLPMNDLFLTDEFISEIAYWQPHGNDLADIDDFVILKTNHEFENISYPSYEYHSNFINRRFAAYGFWEKYSVGLWVQGNIIEEDTRGLIQIESKDINRLFIEGGYSGTPILDLETNAIVGIVRSKIRDVEGYAHMLPLNIIHKNWNKFNLIKVQQTKKEEYKTKIADDYLEKQLQSTKESIGTIGRLIAELEIKKTLADTNKDKERYDNEILRNKKLLDSYSLNYQELKLRIEQGLTIAERDIIAKQIDPFADIKINLNQYSKLPNLDLNFIGRESYMLDIWQRLIKKEKVGITGIGGMGGVGKTAITVQICNLIKETWKEEGNFPKYLNQYIPNKGYFIDGILWIRFEKDEPLSVLIDEKIEDQIACSLFANYEIGKRLKSINKVLSYYDILIVLDSAEQNKSNYLTILKHFNNFPILITSREDLSDIDYQVDVKKMKEDEAIKLFNKYYFKSNWRPKQLNDEEINSLRILLGNEEGVGHLPLAIKLLAVRAKQYKRSIGEIKEEFEKKRLEILHVRDLNEEEDKNKEAIFCFELSFDDLSDLSKEIFMRCGLFFYPFSKNRIADIENFKDQDIEEDFDELVKVHLIEREGEEYTIHPLLREFALYKANESGLVDTYYDDQIKMYLDTRVDDFFDNDLSQIQDLITYCKSKSNFKTILSFADMLNEHLFKSGLWERKTHINTLAIEAAKKEQDNEKLGIYLFEKGDTLSRQKNNKTAIELLKAAKQVKGTKKNKDLFIDYLIETDKSYLKKYAESYSGNFMFSRIAAKETDKVKNISRFLRTQSWIYNLFNSQSYKLAIIDFSQENTNPSSKQNYIRAFSDLLSVYNSLNIDNNSLIYAEKLLDFSDEIQSFEDRLYSYEQLLEVSCYLIKIEKAEKYLDSYKKIAQRAGIANYIQTVSKYQAIISYYKGNYDEALHLIGKSDDDIKHIWRGKIHIAKNDFKQAVILLQKAEKFFIEKHQLINLANVYLSFAIVELKKTQMNIMKCIEYYTRAVNTFRWFDIQEKKEEKYVKEEVLQVIDNHTFSSISGMYKNKYVLYVHDENNQFIETAPSLPDFFIKDLPDTIVDVNGKEMVLIPEGTCFIGKGEIIQYDLEFILNNMEDFWNGEYKDIPKATELYLYPFYIDKEPISNGEYLKFCEATDYNKPISYNNEKGNITNPVTNINIEDAKAYIEWYNTTLHNDCKKDLPTTPEWEKAMRKINYSFYGIEREKEKEIGKDNPDYFMLLSATTTSANNYESSLKFVLGDKLYEYIKNINSYDEIENPITYTDFVQENNKSIIIDKLVKVSDERKGKFNWVLLLRLIAYSQALKGYDKKSAVVSKIKELNGKQIIELFEVLLNEFIESYFSLKSTNTLYKLYLIEGQSWINYLRSHFHVESPMAISKTLLKEFVHPNSIKELSDITSEREIITENAEMKLEKEIGFRCVYPIFSNQDLQKIIN